jgi:adenylate cyclase
MNTPLQIKIFDRQQVVYTGEFFGEVELGRQKESETVYRPKREGNSNRLPIARFDEISISREHAGIEAIARNRIRVRNLSKKLPIRLPAGGDLNPGDATELPIPLILTLGPRTIRVQEFEDGDNSEGILQSLSEVSRAPGKLSPSASSDQLLSLALGKKDLSVTDQETFVRVLQGTIGVLQNASEAEEFFNLAATAMVDNIGMDTGWVLLREGDEWVTKVMKMGKGGGSEADRQPSRKFLNKVVELQKTSWQVPDLAAGDSTSSLAPVKAVVAAPILAKDGTVMGALYGDRRQVPRPGANNQFSRLEALLVEVLASSVAAGLARLRQEGELRKVQDQLTLAFGEKLARELKEHPDLINGREAEITVLFADIRGFSAVSKTLGHKRTFEWINHVMEELSQCVVEHDGLVVDYIGDEIMALWGAPKPQAEHARLAVRSALAMQRTIPRLNDEWRSTLSEEMGIGIGINTGLAQIGNTGSRMKFKYGPLGNTVNLASRVQGTTKYLKCSTILTESTFAMLGPEFHARRLCSVRVINIKDPVYLYEVVDPETFPEDWEALRSRYEEALEAFEEKQFREAARGLGDLLIRFPDDAPSLILMQRAVNGLVKGAETDHPVWELPGK